MTHIISSTVLRNEYNDVSEKCHSENEPIFITKNGQGDLAVMSIEKYDELSGKAELCKKLMDGLEDIKVGKVKPYREIRKELLNF